MKKSSTGNAPVRKAASKRREPLAAKRVARGSRGTPRSATADPTGQLRRRALERLMREREEVMTLYFRVAGVDPVDSRDPDEETLKKFCHLLVDYLAAGHVTVLDPLLARRPNLEVMSEINGLYPRLSNATENALAFADRYRDAKHSRSVARYAHDLSDLGEQLAVRVDIEDRLIPLLGG